MTDEREISIAPYEREAADARRRIAVIIDRIQDRLSPASLLDSATDEIAHRGSQAIARGRNRLQQHPTAVGFAAGLVALLAVRRFID